MTDPLEELMCDEDRMERVAPQLAPQSKRCRSLGLLRTLYLALGMRTLLETGLLLGGASSGWSLFWPSNVSLSVVIAESLLGLCLILIAVHVERLTRNVVLLCWAIVVWRVCVTICEVIVRFSFCFDMRGVATSDVIRFCVVLPLEAVAVPVALGWFAWTVSRHNIAGLQCRTCGYNLYGLREARCPECGTPFGHGRG